MAGEIGTAAPLEKTQVIFVNSMSDLFHEDVPEYFICDIFDVMNLANQHIYQILTKRSELLLDFSPGLLWSENIWMGVSVENQRFSYRIDDLRRSDAKRKFLSVEPLLGPAKDLDLEGIDWVIVGGESGPKARPMDLDWARDIQDLCKAVNIPFCLKQRGGKKDKRGGDKAVLDGRLWRAFPRFY